MPDTRVLNVLSVDVEDYHDQLALDFQDRIVPPNAEAERCTHRMLDLFDEYDVRATCFLLGEIAEHFPSLVRRIADAGHQLGVHGYHHLHVFRQTPEQFRDSIGRAKALIEDVSGKPADAHRAVAFSIGKSTMWAMEILADLGFVYDSSIFPIRGRRYGVPDAPRFTYRHELPSGRWLWEVPMSTVEALHRRWPACGGGYLRLFPFGYTRYAFRRLNTEGRAAIVYLHPYEIEPHPTIEPLPGLTWKQRLHFRFFNFNQLVGRRHTERKLRNLFETYRFGTIAELIDHLAQPTVPSSARSHAARADTSPPSHASPSPPQANKT